MNFDRPAIDTIVTLSPLDSARDKYVVPGFKPARCGGHDLRLELVGCQDRDEDDGPWLIPKNEVIDDVAGTNGNITMANQSKEPSARKN